VEFRDTENQPSFGIKDELGEDTSINEEPNDLNVSGETG
jgi:hypothetical protein